MPHSLSSRDSATPNSSRACTAACAARIRCCSPRKSGYVSVSDSATARDCCCARVWTQVGGRWGDCPRPDPAAGLLAASLRVCHATFRGSKLLFVCAARQALASTTNWACIAAPFIGAPSNVACIDLFTVRLCCYPQRFSLCFMRTRRLLAEPACFGLRCFRSQACFLYAVFGCQPPSESPAPLYVTGEQVPLQHWRFESA